MYPVFQTHSRPPMFSHGPIFITSENYRKNV